jgi:hypothetical protein
MDELQTVDPYFGPYLCYASYDEISDFWTVSSEFSGQQCTSESTAIRTHFDRKARTDTSLLTLSMFPATEATTASSLA